MFMYLYSQDCPDDVRQQFGPNKKCAVVYEFYNEQGEILYVGKTTNFCSRWSTHFRSDKPILEVTKIVIKTYKDYSEASFVEAQQIAKLKPVWNKQGKEESVSRKKMQYKSIFTLNVLTKKLAEFRDAMNAPKTVVIDEDYRNKVLADRAALQSGENSATTSFYFLSSASLEKDYTALGYKYLVPCEYRRYSTAHLWTGEDTLCKLYSTNGLKKENYVVKDGKGFSSLCGNCVFRHKREVEGS